ncbi:hypothetical protein SARC_12888 [Sphaeroforma arctica JP610]|uniref:Uncharacterized protein n=1 Tax=Sphaeroforma arctica JP610 TaxID=667725 RepID=A0A0L0FCU3_9EUKA|nr:hypothetical protein SARC_12888 [Sphaeroforma arctica JP610]KNC74569.1 hypothetical protein SARC_12888 [Sphaeroforma arctica JP610]|eukprot:XP_014148471.1 hypothetical protein SARC_12888 [Sphaeroforma arctica JP610]
MDDNFHRWVNSHGRSIKERRYHDKSSVTVPTAKLIHSGKDYMLNGFTTADQASIYQVLGERWMDVGMVDSVVLARHNKMLSILFIQPRSAMLETADRLAAVYDREPEKSEALLQNIETYGVWAVIAYHLFKLRDQQVQQEAELTTEQMFDWEQPRAQQPQLADAGGIDQTLAVRLVKAFDGLYGKAVMTNLRVIHDSKDLFIQRLYAKNGRLGVHLRQNYKYTGLARVLEYLRNDRIHTAGPAMTVGPTVQEVSQGDRFAMDGTLAALNDLRTQLKNQLKNKKASQKDLRKRIDETKRQKSARKRTRSEASEDEDGVEVSGDEPDVAFKERMSNIRCFKCHKMGQVTGRVTRCCNRRESSGRQCHSWCCPGCRG